jgi:hypothetical protein
LEKAFFDDDVDDSKKEKHAPGQKQNKNYDANEQLNTDAINVMDIDDNDDDDDEKLFSSTSKSPFLIRSQVTKETSSRHEEQNSTITTLASTSFQGQVAEANNTNNDKYPIHDSLYEELKPCNNANQELDDAGPSIELDEEENAKVKLSNDTMTSIQQIEIMTAPAAGITTTTSTRNTPFNLEYEIDRLYEECDKNTVTIKTFCSALKRKSGILLDKGTKSHVRERLLGLVKKRIVPFSTENYSLIERHRTKDSQERFTNDQKPDESLRVACVRHTNSTAIVDAATEPPMNIQPADSDNQNTDSDLVESNRHAQHSTVNMTSISTEDSYSRKQHCNQEKNKILQANETQPLPGDSEVTTKRKRARAKKTTVNSSTSENLVGRGQIEHQDSKAPAPRDAKPRKRTRKTACALCKTCPCQKVQAQDDVVTLDMTAFSRSGVAMEKALIRRIQKLEKSAENLEEQTEMVRRKLKSHRRTIWKQKELELNGAPARVLQPNNICEDSWYLPDVEVFEQQQIESVSMDPLAVQRAQLRLFHRKPSKCRFSAIAARKAETVVFRFLFKLTRYFKFTNPP